jgi:hypothetical protein|tara:strand:+ start:3958 stop:4317 length:360 start_codon:yes stop_codon:yes gene_type:complete
MLNQIVNTVVNPLTVGLSLTVVGAAGLVGGMFTDVMSKNIPFINVSLGTVMYVVPLSVGLVTLARHYGGFDIPFLGGISDEAGAEGAYIDPNAANWGEDSTVYGGRGVPTYYGSAEWQE